MRFTTKLLPSCSGNMGILHLNRPEALHALTIDMIECFQDVLAEWHDPSSSLKCILLKASPCKRPAFCAGGDVKAVYESGMNDTSHEHGLGLPNLPTGDFFRQEYIVNHMIATWDRPQISFWDGVVMGGGAGISVHGKYRVSTENSVFAMPETGIGLFPDVGSTYWMPRMLSGGLASYVALTGVRLKAPDLHYTGLATHHVPSERLEELEKMLVQATNSSSSSEDVVAPVLMSFHEYLKPEESFLAKHRDMIDQVFLNAESVEEIVAKLHELDNSFGRDTLQTIQKMSPTSLKLTLEGLKRGAKLNTVGECLQMEFRMSQACMRPGSDFYEGIRAVLVDKDNNPKWSPASLEEVTHDMVESMFADLGDHEWEIPKVVKTSML